MWLGKVIFSLLLGLITLIPSGGMPGSRISAPFTAKVIRIIDGDSMEVLDRNRAIHIRLAHIDCPEQRPAQPYGMQAKNALSDLCFGQYVIARPETYDRYGRMIAIVINSRKQVVNQEMVRLGMAWHFRRYSSDRMYSRLEQEARKQKKGLWQDLDPVPPWKWRK